MRTMLGTVALCAALVGSLPALAGEPAPAAQDHASLEQKLAAAQARLEAAAREVADLSAGLVPPEIHELEAHLGPPRAMLGVQLGEGRPGGGVRVAGVSPGGPAAAAGIRGGDFITSINGHRVATPTELVEQVRGLKVGEEAKVEVDRGGKLERFGVTARIVDPRVLMLRTLRGDGGPDAPEEIFEHFEMGPGGAFGELELASVSAELGRYFATDKGVLVVHAPADGALQLHDGDVITAIDGREPQGVAHALRILRSYQSGERVTLAIWRDRKLQKLEVTMAAGTHGGHPRVPLPPLPPRPPLAPKAGAPPPPPAPPRTAPPAGPGSAD